MCTGMDVFSYFLFLRSRKPACTLSLTKRCDTMGSDWYHSARWDTQLKNVHWWLHEYVNRRRQQFHGDASSFVDAVLWHANMLTMLMPSDVSLVFYFIFLSLGGSASTFWEKSAFAPLSPAEIAANTPRSPCTRAWAALTAGLMRWRTCKPVLILRRALV